MLYILEFKNNMNLFENIFDKFTKQAQPMPSFGTPQAPRTNSYVAPNIPYSEQNTGTGFWSITQLKPINSSLPMWMPEPVFQKDPSDELKKEFWFNDTDIEFLRQAKKEWYDSDMAFEYITKKKQQEKQNIYSWDPSVDNTFMNVVWGAIAEIPKVAWEVGSFLWKASQYMPANLLWTALEAWFTDKTYWQLREEQKAQAEQLATAWQAGKEFVQKYGAYNPESTGAKVWETITDIGSAFVWPNKAKILKEWTGFVKWILPKTLNLASEWALAWAKYDVATKGEITKEWVWYGAGGNIVAWGILWWGKKIIGALKWKTPEETLIAKLWQEKVKWVVKWKVVNVPVPEKWIIETVTMGVWRPNDPKVLAGRALTPSYAGKTPKQIVNTTADVEKNTRKLWEWIRTGKYKWDISTLEDAANTVVTNLERIGASIWDSIKWAVGNVKPSTETTNTILSTLRNKIEKRSGAYSTLKNFLTDTSKWLSVQDAMKAKRVYQTEIGKLIRSGDAGTDSYSALVKWVQELSDNIDNIVINSKWGKKFLEEKSQYAHLKKIVSDIAKSASVEWRRSPQTFVEQLGMVESLMEWVKNPLSTAGRVFAKEIGELNTRDWAWKELIKIYDTEAIKAMKGKKPIVKPNSTTNAKQPRSIVKPSTKSDSDIPEGYFKNAFWEIVKNPSNKKGGFIKIPWVKSESNPIVNKQTWETLNQAIEKLRKNNWSEKDITKFKDSVLWKKENIIKKEWVLDTVNPTWWLFVDYTPKKRASSIISSKDLTTLDKTLWKSPDDYITIYRGTVKWQKEMNPWDFVTDLPELAKSYAGWDKIVISKRVKYSDVIDDIENWWANEYLYIPKEMQKWDNKIVLSPQKTVKPKNLTEWKQSATMGDMETKKLIEEARKYKSAEEFINEKNKERYDFLGKYNKEFQDINKSNELRNEKVKEKINSWEYKISTKPVEIINWVSIVTKKDNWGNYIAHLVNKEWDIFDLLWRWKTLNELKKEISERYRYSTPFPKKYWSAEGLSKYSVNRNPIIKKDLEDFLKKDITEIKDIIDIWKYENKEIPIIKRISDLFEKNKNAPKWVVKYSDMAHIIYDFKNKELKSIIDNILDNKYKNISVWKRDWVIYFDIWNKQISFHNFDENIFNKIPDYKKEWVWKQEFNPIADFTKKLKQIYEQAHKPKSIIKK